MIFQKRGSWCFRDENGRLHKFPTEADAKAAYGIVDATKEEVYPHFEEKDEEDSVEQEAVFESESSSEEEV